MSKQNITRSLTILFALFVGVLFSGCAEQERPTTPSEENVVEVIVRDQPVPVPEDFKKTLQGLNIRGIALFTNGGRQLLPIDINGKAIDLCRSGTETCKLGITTSELASELSGVVALAGCGRCDAGGNRWSCNVSSSKYSCASSTNNCGSVCQ